MTRAVGLAATTFLSLYVVDSFVTGPWIVWIGGAARLISPALFAILAIALARRCRDQARVFWNLNAMHGIIWVAGQMMRTPFEVTGSGVTVVSAADATLVASTIPLAAALYGRPDRDRPRWISRFVLVDFTLIALFAGFAYIYFSIGHPGAPADAETVNLMPLVTAIDLVIAGWAAAVWFTSETSWRQVLGVYAIGLVTAFAGALAVDRAGQSSGGTLWDLVWVVPYAVMAIAALLAYDQKLFAPSEDTPPTQLPVTSLAAITLLVAIPLVDLAGRQLATPPAIEAFRTRLTLTVLVLFGIALVIREFMSRRALRTSGQQVADIRGQLAQREKLAAVGQVIPAVAHRLRNPLQAILGYTELLLAGKHTAIENEELRAIRDNATQAAGVVRNLMTSDPVAAAPFAVMPLPEDDLDKTPRRRTALVVDDEESNAALVRRLLTQAGYDVESTTLSRRALVMIERADYDAVICDVKMPELGGQELYGRVCQIRPELARRFIFITGDIDGQDTRQFLDQSGCSYFMKPFNLERLTAAVDLITGAMPPDTIG